jgi:glycerol uptake facilitator-like aquaporin
MFIVSILLYATGSATGAHINSVVTMATVFTGHCHPVRGLIYIFCQLVGGSLGGAVLRVTLGDKMAYKLHNAGCWIDPEGEVGVWQAALIEFICMFILLSVDVSFVRLESILTHQTVSRFLAYGVGLDPHQAKLYGVKYGPLLVGSIVGLM